jgi:hypothetical protein
LILLGTLKYCFLPPDFSRIRVKQSIKSSDVFGGYDWEEMFADCGGVRMRVLEVIPVRAS